MNNLTGFYFDQFALNFLIQFILALGMTLYLLRIRNKTASTKETAVPQTASTTTIGTPMAVGTTAVSLLFWGAITLYAGTSWLGATAVWSRQFYAQLLQPIPLTILLVAALIFAYDYPKIPDDPFTNARRREKPIVLTTFILAIFVAIGWALYQFTQLSPNGTPQPPTQVIDSWLAFGFLWTAITFLRRVYTLSRHRHPTNRWWQHLRYPAQPSARVLYLFFIVSLSGILITTVMALTTLDTIPQTIRDFPPTIGLLLTLFLISTVYLSSTGEQSTFIVRLVGITLVTIFLIIGIVSLTIPPIFAANIQPAPDSLPLHSLLFTPQPDGSYTVTTTETQFDSDWGQRHNADSLTLPFEFPFYQQAWSTVALSETGVAAFGNWSAIRYAYNHQPAITAVRYQNPPPATTFVKTEPERVLITWQFTNPFVDAMQIILYQDGSFDINYQRLSRATIERVGIQSGNGGQTFTPHTLDSNYNQTAIAADGLLIDYPIQTRQTLHTFVQPLIYLLLITTLLIAFGFPLLFQRVLIRPLNNLVAGVRAVQQGDLQVEVPVQSQDEIGVVTAAFNQMVQAVHQADQELESQVIARTQELADSEQRFRGLAAAAYEAIIIHRQQHIIDINETVTTLFGYDEAALIGQPITSLLTPDAQTTFQALDPNTETTIEVDGLTQTGDVIPLEIRTNSLPYQNETAQVIVARDLHERKQIEAQQQHLGALEERERIGRELHDDLGQVMGYFNVQIEAALVRLQRAETAVVRNMLTELGQIAQESHDSLRQYILGIRTGTATATEPFWPSLNDTLTQFQKRHNLPVELTITGTLADDLPLTSHAQSQLLRIIQEGLTNIYKHAQASQAHLIFTLAGDEVQVILKDNGRGFDPTTIEEGHFGLQIMQERAESVNGRLHLTATPNQGTQLQITLPRRRTFTPPATPIDSEESYPWRVLLVDDHPLFIEGLSNMLQSYGVNIVGTANNGRSAIAAIPTINPDLILMDIQMPEQDGIETAGQIKASHPHIKIVMLTSAADEALLVNALQKGASGYLLKNVPATEMLTLLRDVMQGETVLSPGLAAQALTNLASQTESDNGQTAVSPPTSTEPSPLHFLTSRQREVVDCVAQGMNNQQIADQLFISKSTVKYHLKQIMEQLNLSSRNQLIRYVIENR